MAAPAYNLATSGFLAFTRISLSLDQRKRSRDPLSGALDGSNKVFYTNFFPLLTSGSSPLVVYDGVTQVAGTADYDSGEVVLSAAPTNQPLATYTYTPYTAVQVTRFLLTGFEMLESLWPRAYKVVTSAGALADETSAQLLVADKNGADPDVGQGLLFSQSYLNQALLAAAADYAMNLNVMAQAGRNDHMLREGMRGMMIDKSRRPQNLDLVIGRLREALDELLEAAQTASLGTSVYGGFIASPHTLEYIMQMEWQTASKLFSYNDQLGYNFAYRSFAP